MKACDSECGSEMQGNNGRQWNRLLRFDSWKRQPHPHIISYEPWRPVFIYRRHACHHFSQVTTIIIIQAPCQESLFVALNQITSIPWALSSIPDFSHIHLSFLHHLSVWNRNSALFIPPFLLLFSLFSSVFQRTSQINKWWVTLSRPIPIYIRNLMERTNR